MAKTVSAIPTSIFNMTLAGALKETKINVETPFRSKKLPQYYTAIIANLGGFTMGIAFFWTATAIPDMRLGGQFGVLTKLQENWITSILYVSALVSCPLAGYCVEKFGRRKSLLILTFPFVSGWAIIAFAQNLPMIYIGRFITGVCAGSYGIIVPVYVAETSEVAIRGMLTCFFELMICLGTLYVYIVGTYTSWKVQAIVCGIVPIIHHFFVLTLPESPRYLLENGEPRKAISALKYFRGATTDEHVQPEFSEMLESVEKSKSERNGWRTLLDKGALRAIFIGLGLMTFLQFSFINPILTYTIDIFQTAGSYDKYMSTIIIGATQSVVNIVPFFLVDRFGRRILLLISLATTSLSLVSLGLYFHMKTIIEEYTLQYLSWLPITSLIAYVISCSLGIAPLPWVVVGEVVPTNAKGIACGIINIWSRIMSIAGIYFFLDLLDTFGNDGGYWFIALICCIGFLFVYIFVPETKGKSLDEIQVELKSK